MNYNKYSFIVISGFIFSNEKSETDRFFFFSKYSVRVIFLWSNVMNIF